MSIAIKVENLSKAYRIGEIGTGTISQDIERWWITKVMKREDPFLKLGETNDRTTKGQSNVVWSLKDIDFEIEQGDAVGIIGRNGAGKSTLLKILSRVTAPTTGRAKIKGRVASLLEVGTGFHPELTGRENIYLNGSILGMRKREIDRKLDEIIDFSGVERYIDTPVKRYSSGMSVRLAFAVAAHLDSEILIVDEVLAVGDAEFQKKCLGKMHDVSKWEGRTVLFVSHNLASVKALCDRGLLLSNGAASSHLDSIDKVIGDYTKVDTGLADSREFVGGGVKVHGFSFKPNSRRFPIGDALHLKFKVENELEVRANVVFNIEVKTSEHEPIFSFGNEFTSFPLEVECGKLVHVEMKINEVDLRPGDYHVLLWLKANNIVVCFDFISGWAFTVEADDYLDSGGKLPYMTRHGAIVKKYSNRQFDRLMGRYRLEI